MSFLYSLSSGFPWCNKPAAPAAPAKRRAHGRLDPETLFQPRYSRSQKVFLLELAMTGGWITYLDMDEHLEAKGNRSMHVSKRFSELRKMLGKMGVIFHERDITLASGKVVKEFRLPWESIRKIELKKAGLVPCSL